MKRLIGLLAALAVSACGGEHGNVVKVKPEDAAMEEARAEAQRTFPSYLARAAAPAPGTDKYLVKVRIEDAGGVEYVWVKKVERAGAGFAGIIDNEPVMVRSVMLGQRYAFNTEDVTDWMYMKDGKIHGGYSIRALLPKMPPAKAKEVQAMLAPIN